MGGIGHGLSYIGYRLWISYLVYCIQVPLADPDASGRPCSTKSMLRPPWGSAANQHPSYEIAEFRPLPM